MGFESPVVTFLLYPVGGIVIAVALLAQLFVNSTIGKVSRFSSAKTKFVAYSFRFFAALVSFVVLVAMMRLIKQVTVATGPSVIALVLSFLVTLLFGLKGIKRG